MEDVFSKTILTAKAGDIVTLNNGISLMVVRDANNRTARIGGSINLSRISQKGAIWTSKRGEKFVNISLKPNNPTDNFGNHFYSYIENKDKDKPDEKPIHATGGFKIATPQESPSQMAKGYLDKNAGKATVSPTMYETDSDDDNFPF